MAFISYINYDEYVALGGTVSSTDFPKFEREAQRWIDYFTFKRIGYLTTIPDEVKEVLTAYVDKLFAEFSQTDGGVAIKSYSNKTETITYNDNAAATMKQEFCTLATNWLPNYLVARSVNFDAEEYIQSVNNDS